ncbi:hypothetical protein BI343_09545 [Chromobacterium amazonense]|uniref:hypothetical protein n=1 Tax=Chromobacterium amazonense TaxID=1382803 RepID=UPI0008DA89C9|nr:hypothetical protein [Chromobacterium amazonense]OHX17821.1 hypothetical protein BI343_09545 [Chromobacterium amazonense]
MERSIQAQLDRLHRQAQAAQSEGQSALEDGVDEAGWRPVVDLLDDLYAMADDIDEAIQRHPTMPDATKRDFRQQVAKAVYGAYLPVHLKIQSGTNYKLPRRWEPRTKI